nr:Fe-S-cluster oxidoreductase [Neptuniibacter halophilus]
MECRASCGACCIAPSISSLNKPAGERCKHLSEELLCLIFDSPERPAVCAGFTPEAEFCGNNQREALQILTLLERSTA